MRVSKRLLNIAALIALFGGLAIAVFVVPPGPCPMDSSCGPNLTKAAVAAGGGVVAFILALLAALRTR
jgi:hypothetical protein